MEYKTLNGKGAILGQNELETYLEKIASDHSLKSTSDKNTYPIPNLKENFEVITHVYHLLNEHMKLKIPIHPAGEWILDNYYVIDETVKSVKQELNMKKYKSFLGLSNGRYSGFARIYLLANEMVSYSDNKIDANSLSRCLTAYQKRKTLNMEEIWNIPLFIKIALIQNIKDLSEKIYLSQMQKYRVENILERLVENKNKEELQFTHLGEYKAKVKGYGEMKYPFIEYLSYRLKKYGKKAYPYLAILEEEVEKMGVEVAEVAQKEHFDIATNKISMGNAITSIKTLNRISMAEIFEEINGVEDILRQDPAGVYEKMDHQTKVMYRNSIKELSKKTRISEIYIARRVWHLANDAKTQLGGDKKSHVGYYLISKGKQELYKELTGKIKKEITPKAKITIALILLAVLSIVISVGFSIYLYQQIHSILLATIMGVLLYIPIQTIIVQITQYLLGKFIKPKQIPKLDLETGIPEENATFVVIPTILNSREKVQKLMKNLETYYMANKSENLYFALLGDCTAGQNEKESFDQEVIKAGIEETNKLNQKYAQNSTFPKFHFLYRKRTWNAKEECYLGWERKRGLLNQFNEYILGKEKNEFLANTIEEAKKLPEESQGKINNSQEQQEKTVIPQIKYIITLDADTQLCLNTGLELIGAMAHILNTPELNESGDCVIQGHGLIQPRVGIGLSDVQKSSFTKIYAGSGGKDAYTNAISDIYQDNFEEGIFTGKGIYDVATFSKVLSNEIPENTVLSHDLLEGSYLRCGLASDIMLMDGYPVGYNSFKARLHRWIRGDWQVSKWIFSKIKNKKGETKKNPLNLLSKYKIADNLIRSLQEPAILLCLIYITVLDLIYKIKVGPIVTILILSALIASILEILNRIIFKKEEETLQKTFNKSIAGVKASLIRGILALASLPDKAYFSINAGIKTIYRMNISKKHFLEWMTAEEAEKNAKKDVKSYYQNMFANVVIGIGAIILLFLLPKSIYNILLFILASLWLIAPAVFCYISKENIKENKLEQLTKQEQDYLLEVGKRTWQYFKDNMNENSKFLPPDNYQEDRMPKIANRTSPTNIGLGILAVISSFDLNYENLENTIDFLEKMIATIMDLPKWNGHLYNWYNLDNLTPLYPRYISSVDSGNFVGYLFTAKQFLKEVQNKIMQQREDNTNYNAEKQKQQTIAKMDIAKQENKNHLNKIKDKENTENNKENNFNKEQILPKVQNLILAIDKLIEETDFSKLYDEQTRLFSIGFNIEENKLTDSYYDLLASEARQTSLIAISKKDVPAKHWNNLSRTLTILNKYKGLISWSGTAFEYLMPNTNIPNYPGSLLDESTKFMIMSQKEYAKKLNIPWGISESAFHLKDLNHNYQYKAFGIPWLGLKRGLGDEMVVASYGSIMAIAEEPKQVLQNLKKLEEQGMYQKYGFYESIDYTPTRLKKGQEYAAVKTYMAHHQGLILLAINNLFSNHILQKRFMANPELEAIDILLQEKMPENVILTKEEKEKVEKIKYTQENDYYTQREITKTYSKLPQINNISSHNYTIMMDAKGAGYSKYEDILINRYQKNADVEQGIFFFFKNVKTKRIWTANQMSYLAKPDKYTMCFMPDKNKITRQDGSIETIMKIGISPEEPVELRKIELVNHGLEDETIEISSFLEPVLSTQAQDTSHPSFNNLFLNYEYIEELGAIVVNRRRKNAAEKQIYLGVCLGTENETIGELEYEVDKEKFYGRNNIGVPRTVQNSSPLGKQIGYTTDPIISMKRTISIKPEEKITLNFIMAVGNTKEQVVESLKHFNANTVVEHQFELAKAKVEAQNRYLGVNSKQLELYQKILGYLWQNNPLKTVQLLTQYQKKQNHQTGYYTNYLAHNEIPENVQETNSISDKQIQNPLQSSNQNLNLQVSNLWQYGISGDLPILLVKIKAQEDTESLQEILKMYNYFYVNNIRIDLVILNEEKYSYQSQVKESIFNCILNENLSYLQNCKGGIFILENLSEEEIAILEGRSNLSLDASTGSIYRYLKELEEDYLETIKETPEEEKVRQIEEVQPIREKLTELKYLNEYGGFSKDGKEYHIRVNKEEMLPTVWSHILTNQRFGTLVTESMGGYTWSQNSRLNRVTAWHNSPVTDIPSEIIYLQDKETKKTWSLGLNPCPDENDYYITYGFGYAKYQHNSKGLTQKLEMFVPLEDNIKVQILNLENNELKKKKVKLVYYIKPVLGEDELKTNGYLNLNYFENANMICMNNLASEKEFEQYVFVSSSEKISSYTGSKQDFIGKGNLSNPEALHKIELNKQNSLWQEGIIAIQCEVELEALESKKIILSLGVGKTVLECQDLAYQYNHLGKVQEEYSKIKKYWKDKTEKLQVTTPLESTNLLLNGWLIYQVLASRIWGRTGYYQSGGAFGFRDQLQDTIALKYIEPERMKEQILKHCAHQFKEGDVEHWWHDETGRGIRTRFSDDRLWLAYIVENYIEFTGDTTILDEIVPYREGVTLEEGIDEKYDSYPESELKESVYEHCKKAIQISLNFGENGLPKIGSGDWNDGFSEVGNLGKGESVWLGFFLYDILQKFIPIANQKNEEEIAKQYAQIAEKLRKALNSNGWDGRWFRRAFMDDGNKLGSIQNEECRIDSIAQSWSVISGAADNDKKYISMESLENHLIDKENGIIKLLDPPFEKGELNPGYIKAYLPGTRENGGQYTHSSIWAIMAFCMLGFGAKGAEYYRMINPIEHSRTKEAANKYKVEPYVVAADIYGQRNLAGRGGWTWYTGSASWMYEAGIKYLLGLKIQDYKLKIEPCIPNDWKEYTMKYKYGNSIYHIHISNPNGKTGGEVAHFKLNEQEIAEKEVILNPDGGIYNIEIEI